ncbi:peroxiredoxin [Allofrancisella guangzhouensis]|uniref:Glutathione-dependent peroxiredoxin n=1 Tax=Allofrancisella guangzhouensis TaxID=594679 RepID=A0A0A8E5B2_9GAMM|nr:peroxiredoxin [Allofrancisella guangzhouensis]AJC49183.1 peroxiredoxin [Allofrancisella guangzhouensis]MBK2026758.1 peroxiredoxin [Allofrancisella guangzhouensis]MBK2044430.1 peroxiredoxin [Allofrancisella guangzhouensis]MBK2045362.1 peroxiredoxin [Allofrancisella guangzhouensis]
MIKKVPSITFKTRVRDESIGGSNPFRWQDLTTSEIFGNKRVIVFSLPGAFTPTCSTYQLPGFENNFNKFKELGIDEIYVLSVNDSFVMNKWIEFQKIKNIKPIPDGNGEFTAALDMLVDKENLGFGKRSWRYAMVVKNGNIEKFFVEPGKRDNAEDDPYGETSPENLLKYLESK